MQQNEELRLEISNILRKLPKLVDPSGFSFYTAVICVPVVVAVLFKTEVFLYRITLGLFLRVIRVIRIIRGV